MVAVWSQNVRAKIRSADRVHVQSATASSPKTVRILAVTVAESSPRPSPGRVRNRNQSASASRRSQSVIVSSPRPKPLPCPVRSRATSTASSCPYSVRDQSGDMTHGSRFNYKLRRSARHFVNRRAKVIQAVSTARFCPSPLGFKLASPRRTKLGASRQEVRAGQSKSELNRGNQGDRLSHLPFGALILLPARSCCNHAERIG